MFTGPNEVVAPFLHGLSALVRTRASFNPRTDHIFPGSGPNAPELAARICEAFTCTGDSGQAI